MEVKSSMDVNCGCVFAQLPNEIMQFIISLITDKDHLSLSLTCSWMLNLLQPMRKNLLLPFPTKSEEKKIRIIRKKILGNSMVHYAEKLRDKHNIKEILRWKETTGLVTGLIYYARKPEVGLRYNRRFDHEMDKFVEKILPDESCGFIISIMTVENKDTKMISFVLSILKRCQNITKIQIQHDVKTLDFRYHLKFGGFGLLQLDDDYFFSELGFQKMINGLPRIRKLVLLSYRWSVLSCAHVKNLLSVANLDRVIVNPDINLPSGWTSDVYIGHYVSADDLANFLNSCRHITSLTVYNLKDDGFSVISDHLSQSLLELEIKGKYSESDGVGIQKLISNCTRLQSFSIKESRISRVSLFRILRLPMMKQLAFVKCDWLDEFKFPKVARYFENIEDLDFSNSLDVDYKVLQNIVRKCPNLEKLKLTRHGTPNDIYSEAGTRLKYLDVTHCSWACELDEEAGLSYDCYKNNEIVRIPEKCPALKHLRISQYYRDANLISDYKLHLPPSTIKFLRSKIDMVEVVADDWADEDAKPDCVLCNDRNWRQEAYNFYHDPLELNPDGFQDDDYETQDYADPSIPGPSFIL